MPYEEIDAGFNDDDLEQEMLIREDGAHDAKEAAEGGDEAADWDLSLVDEDDIGAGGFLGVQKAGQPSGRGGLVVVQKGDKGGVGVGQANVAGRGHARRWGRGVDQGQGGLGA